MLKQYAKNKIGRVEHTSHSRMHLLLLQQINLTMFNRVNMMSPQSDLILQTCQYECHTP